MKCEKGRWRRAITKADAARILLALQPTTTTTAAPATTAAPDVPVTAAPPAVVPTVPPTTAPPVAPSDLDPAWGVAGKRRHEITLSGEHLVNVTTVTPTSAGLYVTLYTTPLTGFGASGLAVVRFDAAGSLDTAFSGDGVLDLPNAWSAVIDPSGRVYAADRTPSAEVVTRYTAAGVADITYGTGGVLANGCGRPDLTAMPDGSVIAWNRVGTCTGMVRLQSNGSSAVWGDLSPLGGANIGSAVPGPGGSIYVQTGQTMSFGGPSFTILRLTSSGAVDGSFGTGGLVTPPSGITAPTSMQVLSDGSMLFTDLSGPSFLGSSINVRRVLVNGSVYSGNGFTGGAMSLWGGAITPLPAGGFVLTSSILGAVLSFTNEGVGSGAVAGVSGPGRLVFDSGLSGPVSFTVVSGGRIMLVLDRFHSSATDAEAQVLELLRFTQAA
jgi:hypothetical protein